MKIEIRIIELCYSVNDLNVSGLYNVIVRLIMLLPGNGLHVENFLQDKLSCPQVLIGECSTFCGNPVSLFVVG